MIETSTSEMAFGRELFRCRPRPLWQFFALRYQGALPTFKWLRFLNPVITVVSPIAESFTIACLPGILMILLLQFGLGLKPPNEPSWVRPFYVAFLAVSVPLILWWHWATPRNDGVAVCERGFRWRISLSRWDWLRSQGSIPINKLESFSYRSDCFEAEPVDTGKTTADKLERILLELALGRHAIAFNLKTGDQIVVEHFFARFAPDDLQRFLAHLATVAEAHRISVAEPTSAQATEQSANLP
jgi:hypothetical protein